MKRFGLVFLVLVFALGLVLAGESVAQTPAGKKVGVLWFQKSGMATNVAKGFLRKMKDLAPEIAIEVKMDMEEGAAKSLYTKWADGEKDGVLFLRSDGAMVMKDNPPKVPGFIGAANSPIAMGMMTDLNKPTGNVTGVTYYIPVDKQFEVIGPIFPEMKAVCLIVKEGHPSAPIEQAETKALCAKKGLEYQEIVCKEVADIAKGVAAMKDKVQLFIIGNQNLIFDNAAMVSDAAGKVPVISYAEKPIKDHKALCGLVANDEKLGEALAGQVVDVLKNGKKVEEVPVQFDPEPRLKISEKYMAAKGVNVPVEIQAVADILR